MPIESSEEYSVLTFMATDTKNRNLRNKIVGDELLGYN